MHDVKPPTYTVDPSGLVSSAYPLPNRSSLAGNSVAQVWAPDAASYATVDMCPPGKWERPVSTTVDPPGVSATAVVQAGEPIA